MDYRDTITKIYDRCSKPNWDSYNASPVTLDSAEIALKFCRLLPLNIKEPNFAASRSGNIGLSWGDETLLIEIWPNKLEILYEDLALNIYFNGEKLSEDLFKFLYEFMDLDYCPNCQSQRTVDLSYECGSFISNNIIVISWHCGLARRVWELENDR